MSNFLEKPTIRRTHEALEAKEFSAQELVESCLDEIEDKDKKINSFLALTPKLALDYARRVDAKIRRKEKLGPLEGVPVAIKDNILVEDYQASAGSAMLADYKAVYDATLVQKIKKAHVPVVGKTNMDEFAMGSSTENSAFGSTKNPHDLQRVPGGSSGGSAAAVAAGFVPFAFGSDTGGSVRQPAALCGVVGLKPTYGTVSRRGLIAMASSLDVIGPITRNVADAELVFNAIKGEDPKDATSHQEVRNFEKEKYIVGIPKEYYQEGLDEETSERLELVQERLAASSLGGKDLEITEVSLPHTEYALACYYIIMPSEVSANLARYDGMRYGHSKKRGQAKEDDIENYYKKIRSEGFGDEVKRRIILGTFALSSGYYDAYYKKAQQVRALIKQDFQKVFKKVDCLLTPTTPAPAFKIGEKSDPLQMYLSDVYTVPANLAGLPALSVPIGKNKKGLPLAGQLIADRFEEGLLFELGKALEGVLS